jgi:hypothetical protein
MRMQGWVTGPGGRGDVAVCLLAASLPARAGCGGADVAHHTARCPTPRTRTAAGALCTFTCMYTTVTVCARPGSLCGAGLGCVLRCACRRERCLERSRLCVCASWGDRVMRGRDVCLSAKGTAVCIKAKPNHVQTPLTLTPPDPARSHRSPLSVPCPPPSLAPPEKENVSSRRFIQTQSWRYPRHSVGPPE